MIVKRHVSLVTFAQLEKAPVALGAARPALWATPGFIKTGISPVLSYSHGLLFKVLKFKSGTALPSAIDMRNIAGLPDPPARSPAYERCHKIAKEQSRRREKRDRVSSLRVKGLVARHKSDI